jgi:hypothetical protein
LKNRESSADLLHQRAGTGHKVIVALTVQEILEHLAKKLVC